MWMLIITGHDRQTFVGYEASHFWCKNGEQKETYILYSEGKLKEGDRGRNRFR